MLPRLFPILLDDPSKAPLYADRVLNTLSSALIACWPLWEQSGTNAENIEGTSARDGTFIGNFTLGRSGIGDGRSGASFDGVDAYVDVYSDSFRDAFDGEKGSIMCWGQVDEAANWQADYQDLYLFKVDNDNRIRGAIEEIDDNFETLYESGNSQKRRSSPSTTLDWFCTIQTWDQAADERVTYFNAVKQGVTQAALGTWAGALNSAGTRIARGVHAVDEFWIGGAAYMTVWTDVLTQALVDNLYPV